MTAKDNIRSTLDSSEMILGAYLGGLSDADLFVRPVPGMNTIAWQLGHLIAAERHFVEILKPGSCPELPAGFAEAHSKETAELDDPSRFGTLEQYQALAKAQREATKAVLNDFPEADFDKTSPDYPPFAPTPAALLSMCGLHGLMHSGQFVAVRRMLGKPVAI
ncbi:MAG: DinB family protein [Isosphaeraceae bacterium]